MKNKVFNMDCVKIMKTYENKFFDLAVVDPPYGININTKYNKLSPNHTAYFTDVETVRLKMVLKDLSADVEAISGIDFNDALKGIIG